MIRCAWSLCETLSQTLSVGMLCDRPRSKGALIFRSALASGAIHWKPTAPVALAASAFVLCARASCVPCAHHSVHVVPCARRRARSGHSSPSHGASAGRAHLAQVLMLRAAHRHPPQDAGLCLSAARAGCRCCAAQASPRSGVRGPCRHRCAERAKASASEAPSAVRAPARGTI